MRQRERKTKHHVLTIAAGFILAAAASVSVSCEKQEPYSPGNPGYDGASGQPETTTTSQPAALGISIPENAEVFSYKGHPSEYAFTVEGAAGRTDVTLTATAGAGVTDVALATASDGGSATVGYTLAADAGSFTVRVEAPGFTLVRTVDVTAYFARIAGLGDGCVLEDDGQGREVSLALETNIPDEGVLELASGASWITSRHEDGRFVATVAANPTGMERNAELVLSHREGLLADVRIPVRQDWTITTPEGDFVRFTDKAFKAACLGAADSDGDGQVSFTEAESVIGLYLRGRGITDLTGLEMFRNLEYFEAQDNDIRNADVLKELHALHWLDLKGNPDLESFDITGCTVFFERCWFDATDKLRWKYYLRQTNVSYDCDMYSTHADVIYDERVSSDWSFQDELVTLQKHTKGDGRKAICLSGIGYLDVDHKDGSFERILRYALDVYLECWPTIAARIDEFDIYMMRHVTRTREEFVYGTDEETFYSEVGVEGRKRYNAERTNLWTTSFNKISPDGKTLVLNLNVDIHPNMMVVPVRQQSFQTDILSSYFIGLYPNPGLSIAGVTSGPYYGEPYYNDSIEIRIKENNKHRSKEPLVLEFFDM